MSNEPCLTCPPNQKTVDPLPQAIAASLENIRQERIRTFAEQPLAADGPYNPSGLERQVDALLDSLHILHRLEQLAAHAARGGQITVDADRLLIAEHEMAFLRLLRQYAPSEAVVSEHLLPASTPRELD
ncbi:MAG TPA: hypothetical protein VFB38_24200 [Chthonomonadaceae bacterium]|nr:hypothetical protein [Chthonomonadaceae bacterium]